MTTANKNYATFTDNKKFEDANIVNFYSYEGRFIKTWWNNELVRKMFVYKSEEGLLKAVQKMEKDSNYTRVK